MERQWRNLHDHYFVLWQVVDKLKCGLKLELNLLHVNTTVVKPGFGWSQLQNFMSI